MFTRHGLRAGVRQVNPHRFRHTFCYLGDPGQCPRARCPVFAWSFEPDDGPSLFCDLRLGAGGKGARCLQPGDAAVGGGLPSRRDCCHQPLRRFAGSAGSGPYRWGVRVPKLAGIGGHASPAGVAGASQPFSLSRPYANLICRSENCFLGCSTHRRQQSLLPALRRAAWQQPSEPSPATPYRTTSQTHRQVRLLAPPVSLSRAVIEIGGCVFCSARD